MSIEVYEYGQKLPSLEPLITLLDQAGYIKYGNARPEQFEHNEKFLLELARELFWLDSDDGRAILHSGKWGNAVETDHDFVITLCKTDREKMTARAVQAIESCNTNWYWYEKYADQYPPISE